MLMDGKFKLLDKGKSKAGNKKDSTYQMDIGSEKALVLQQSNISGFFPYFDR